MRIERQTALKEHTLTESEAVCLQTGRQEFQSAGCPPDFYEHRKINNPRSQPTSSLG